AFGFRHSMILLTDAQNKDLELVASRGYEDATPGAKLPIGLGVIGVAARRKKLLRSVGVSYQLMYARQAGATVGKSGSEGSGPMLPGLQNAASQMAIPLVVRDELTGIFAVESPEQGAFDALDEELLSIIGNMMGAAITNARAYRSIEELSHTLEDRVQRRTEELDSLNALTRQANESHDLDEIIDATAAYMIRHLNVEKMFLLLIDHESGEIYGAGGHLGTLKTDEKDRLQDFRAAIEPELGILYRTIQRKKTLYLDFKRFRAMRSTADQYIAGLGLQSVIQIPAIVDDQVLGVVCVDPGNRKLHRLGLQKIEAIVAQIAGAVKSKQLLERLEEERNVATQLQRETEGLNQLLKRIANLEDIQDLMGEVKEFVARYYGIRYYSLYFVEPELKQMHNVAIEIPDWVSEDDSTHIRNTPIPLDIRGGAFNIALRRAPRLTYFKQARTEGITDIERFITERCKLQNMVVYPLMQDGRPIAFLNFFSFNDRGLNREQLNQLSIVSDQISGIIRMNGLLHEIKEQSLMTEKARQETEALALLSKQTNESTNLNTVSTTLFDYVRKTMNVESFCLFIVDEKTNELYPAAADGEQEDFLPPDWKEGMRVSIEPASGTLYATYARQRPFYLPSIPDRLPTGVDRFIVDTLRLNSVLQIPLVVQGQTIGILCCNAQRKLEAEEIRSIERLCNQIAGSIRLSALLQVTQEAREEAVVAKEEAEQARAESDALLDNVLPRAAARELKETGQVEPVYYDHVSVLFTDFVGFTKAASNLSPTDLIQELDGCFSQFDEVARRNNMEKLKTIGDAYMCAGGLPVPNDSHAVDACLTALEFRSFMKQMALVKEQLGFDFWQIRIGIHSGPVTAGVIGKNKFAYDIWGDTVNVASRMESSGCPGMVNISGATYALVKDLFDCEYRGKVQAKGKGEMDMYFVHRIKSELSADEEGLLPNAMFELARSECSSTPS
ncbi:MAG: GAF domain-containing protein, partial [Leptospiraceae bacterium]|nr:GAF domain-containing protein [Leptospiraceae bacterium]